MESNYGKYSIFSSESKESVVPTPKTKPGRTYEDWLKTDPWIARGGLSSSEEMHQAYTEWVREQSGRRPITNYSEESSRESESRYSSEYIEPPKPQYNSLRDIDDLIKKMGNPVVDPGVSNERVNQILEARKEKINELRELSRAARKKAYEDRIISELEEGNNELDKAIEALKKGRIR